ncbi:MAG TPA: alpha/beta hydrolase [Steroidobacteraceae bacterium]|jgi:acetyl esterase/lipase
MPADTKPPPPTLWVRFTAACSEIVTRLLFGIVNFPARFGKYHRSINLPYGELPQQRLDVYFPLSSDSAPRALVLFWHGGRWTFGDKRDYRFVGAMLASLGCVAVIPNYRHYPAVKMAGFMQDAARALAFAAAHAREFGADEERVFLMGHSAGAHMAALLALDSRYVTAAAPRAARIAGVVGLSGPYDFLPLNDADVQDMFGPPDSYLESQPIHYAHAGAPPFLLIHGLKDDTVRPKNARNLAAALERAGVSVTLRLPEVGHAATAAALSQLLSDRLSIRRDIATFLQPPTITAQIPEEFPRAAYKR